MRCLVLCAATSSPDPSDPAPSPLRQVKDTSQNPATCHFSLDGGKTRFYDLIQLVEFYQLNAGVLPTRLIYFITHASQSDYALRHVAQSF